MNKLLENQDFIKELSALVEKYAAKAQERIDKRWRDDRDKRVNGYYIREDKIGFIEDQFNDEHSCDIYYTEAQARSAMAMARISQIMANDERFGGVITDEEWEDRSHRKHTIIVTANNKIELNESLLYKEFLAFHTKEQAQLFLEENRDLVEDYLMISTKVV